MTEQFTKHRFLMQAGFDALTWLPAIAVATTFRYEFAFSAIDWWAVVAVGLIAAGCMTLAGRIMGMYVHRDDGRAQH
ncbi:MAG: hypothetical protein ACKOYM_02065, partial [Actinomycetes bacterium]